MNLQKTLRNVSICALFLVPIFPLIVANSFFFPFITGKAFYFRVLVEIAFAAWLVLCALDAKYRPKLTPLTVGVTVFALVALVADLAGVNPLRSMWSNFERMEGWITVVHLWALFMAATGIFGSGEQGRRMWHRWLNFEIFVALCVGVYGLWQLFGWAAIHQGSSRIDASLGNAAYMAVYMLWNAGLCAYLFFTAKAKKIANARFLTWAYPILAVFFSFLLFETNTRGTILGWIGGLMLGLFIYAIINRGQSKRSRQVAGGILIAVILIGIGIWSARNAPIIKNNEILGRLTRISLSDTESVARLYIWQMALTGWEHRPILGWGQENFNYIFNADYNPKMWNQEQWFDRAHSVYLDWLTASGLVGLLAYLSLYALFLYAVWKSSLSIGEKSVLTGLIGAYAVHNIFVFDNLASYVPFFAALAFANSFREGKPIRWSWWNKQLSLESVEYIAAPAVIVALLFTLYFFDYRPIEANTRLIAALQSCGNPQVTDASLFQSALAVNVYGANQEIREQLLSCAGNVIDSQQVPGPVKQAFFGSAMQAIQDQIAATPWKDARIYTLGGSFLASVGQFAQAEPLLETAHLLSPAKQSIDLELANAYLNGGEIGKAVTLLAQAYALDQSDGQIKTTYVLALVANGDEAKARQLFGDDPALFDTPQIAQAYMIAKDYSKAIAIYSSLFTATSTDLNAGTQLAQAEYAAGMYPQAVAALQQLEKAHPEYKTQIDAAIQQVESAKK